MNLVKSTWMWYYGDYEVYHAMQVHLRRQEFGTDYPAFWHMASPYTAVSFHKEFACEKKGYITAHSTGRGYIQIDGKKYTFHTKIELEPGHHRVWADVYKEGGLPALFLESDICPSGEGFVCSHHAGAHIPVGWDSFFDSVGKNPEVFPFSYERKIPLTAKAVPGGLLCDFGTELFGYLNISGADAKETLGVYYGESEEEALDTDYTTLYEFVAGKGAYRLRQRAFRYIYIRCHRPEGLEVSADYEYLPLEQKGYFHCDNELFNRIYEACVYTFHLNCREAFLDGIKRDRWIWSGDAYQSARINAYLFADRAIVRRTALSLIGKEPIEQHLNTILDYSFLWIIGLYESYMTYGDRKFLEYIFPKAESLMAFCETRCDDRGFVVAAPGDWTFIDWADIDKTGAVCAEQMLLIASYKAMAAMADVVGTDGTIYQEKALTLTKRVNDFFWNDEKGAYIDSFESGKNKVTRHANIFAVMYDIASPKQKERLAKTVLRSDEVPHITTPYFEGYELDVLAKLGDFKTIEDRLHAYWGGMIRLGASTIWEAYDPALSGIEHYAMYGKKYDKSLCHAWGAGPVYLFGRYYLGVYPTSAGYETFHVEPHLGGLNEIDGCVPTGNGCVKVQLNKKELSVTASKDGGTLIWEGQSYPLLANEPLRLSFSI